MAKCDYQQKSEPELKIFLEGRSSEIRSLEFKPPFAWSSDEIGCRDLKGQVIRAVLSFHNTPGGGRILIGIENDATLHALEDEKLESFPKKDDLTRTFQGYSLMPLEIELSRYVLPTGSVVEISVAEYDEYPAVCAKTPGDEYMRRSLTEGDLYVRARTGAVGSRKATQHEVNELIQHAALKRKRYAREIVQAESANSEGYGQQLRNWTGL